VQESSASQLAHAFTYLDKVQKRFRVVQRRFRLRFEI